MDLGEDHLDQRAGAEAGARARHPARPRGGRQPAQLGEVAARLPMLLLHPAAPRLHALLGGGDRVRITRIADRTERAARRLLAELGEVLAKGEQTGVARVVRPALHRSTVADLPLLALEQLEGGTTLRTEVLQVGEDHPQQGARRQLPLEGQDQQIQIDVGHRPTSSLVAPFPSADGTHSHDGSGRRRRRAAERG
ncbi:MAG TPA: hypothetical protein VHM02_01655 [Thermoanaerobaculia bacterium]|nr:hypothetical protein [Thermoanaerobaculia bacterium]